MSFKKGEIVAVKYPINLDFSNRYDFNNIVFIQKFIYEKDGLFYCERDDGIDGVIGWKQCMRNDFKYKYISNNRAGV